MQDSGSLAIWATRRDRMTASPHRRKTAIVRYFSPAEVLLAGGTTRQLIVYGRIPGSQSAVGAGSYSDAVLITVTYN